MSSNSVPAMKTRSAVVAIVAAATLAFALALAGCSSDDTPTSSPTSTASTAPARTSATASTPTPVTRTPALDAIGVIGHSGATGYNSDGQDHDVPANSWVTGTNPKVDSIYRRLLVGHPALKGHNWNEAASGSSVTSLMSQAQALLAHDPVPDIVFIVSMDNDIRCDGTDEENYDVYKVKVAEVVDYLQGSAPGVKVFFNETPFSVHQYDAGLLTMDGGVEHIDWPGPCDPTSDAGTIDPAGEAFQQQVFDEYYTRLKQVCAEHTDCATDEGALQSEDFTASSDDFTKDLDHLTVSGLAREAAVVWDHLPPDWKK